MPVLQCLLHVPQIEVGLGTAESTTKVQKLGINWDMHSKYFSTGKAQLDLYGACLTTEKEENPPPGNKTVSACQSTTESLSASLQDAANKLRYARGSMLLNAAELKDLLEGLQKQGSQRASAPTAHRGRLRGNRKASQDPIDLWAYRAAVGEAP